MNCPLCHSNRNEIKDSIRVATYFSCLDCGVIFMDPYDYISATAEKERYEKHSIASEDPGYQNFVSEIINTVTQRFSSEKMGLDFGAGNGAVLAKLLHSAGYKIKLWDPFFHSNKEVLNQQYDFIICCETMEHFHHPRKEFDLMHDLLLPGGTLLCQTDVLRNQDFFNWYYTSDPTHVIFYTEASLKWIKNTIGFSEVKIDRRVIEFSKYK